MGPNVSKCVQMGPNGSKYVKNVFHRPKQIQTGPNRPSMVVQNGLKLFKIVDAKNCLKCSKLVLNGTKRSNIFPKWSNIVQYDLIWSYMVQIISLRASKWVRHNQASWSSLKKKNIRIQNIYITFGTA